jgi:hypothetical protein
MTRPRLSALRRSFIALVAAWGLSSCSIAPQDAPWEPLSLEQSLGWATRMKLAELSGDPQQCLAALRTAQRLQFREGAPDAGTATCPLTDVVAIERSSIAYDQELAASCALAAAMYIWEREVVQPAAQAHLQTTVTQIDTFGTFACRNVYGRADARRSEHATANALDVAGFRLANGERVSVLDDWGADTAEAAFLRAVRDGSCEVFSAVLGPEYNSAHANHFHLDMGPFRICS